MAAKRFDHGQSLFVTLGVDKNTSPTDIKRAYHRLVRGCHPDRMVNASPAQSLKAEERTKVLNNVYDILSDATLRAEYDRYLQDRSNTEASNTQSNQKHTGMEPTGEFEPVLVPSISDLLYACAKFVYSMTLKRWKPGHEGITARMARLSREQAEREREEWRDAMEAEFNRQARAKRLYFS